MVRAGAAWSFASSALGGGRGGGAPRLLPGRATSTYPGRLARLLPGHATSTYPGKLARLLPGHATSTYPGRLGGFVAALFAEDFETFALEFQADLLDFGPA